MATDKFKYWVSARECYLDEYKRVRRPLMKFEASGILSRLYKHRIKTSIRGLMALFNWGTGKVYRFLDAENLEIKYPAKVKKFDKTALGVLSRKNGTDAERIDKKNGTDNCFIYRRLDNVAERIENKNGTDAEPYKDSKTEKKRTRDFSPTKKHYDRAKKKGVDIDRLRRRFIEHPKFATYKSLNRAFTTWIDKQAEFDQQKSGGAVLTVKTMNAILREGGKMNVLMEVDEMVRQLALDLMIQSGMHENDFRRFRGELEKYPATIVESGLDEFAYQDRRVNQPVPYVLKIIENKYNRELENLGGDPNAFFEKNA